jgi:hypothetical protein
MATSFVLLLLCLGMNTYTEQWRDTCPLSVLEYHLTLSGEPGAYLHVFDTDLTVFVKGLEVKRWQILGKRGPRLAPRLSRVASWSSAIPPPRIVVQAEYLQENPADTVSSSEEIVAVDDMPETFTFELEDGTHFLVTSRASLGMAGTLRRRLFEMRTACSFLRARLRGQPASMMVLYLEKSPAQHLYWVLQERMGVIY